MGNNNSALIRKPYDNFKMYHPDGTLMCYCSEKKAKWYATRGLGNIKNGKVYLTFSPNGYGEPDLILEGRKNFCVISGKTTDLTKHHIIPTQYRKHFSGIYKDKNSMDLAVLTRNTHNEYEITADYFKEQLYTDFIDENIYNKYRDLKRAKVKSSTLLHHVDKIPPAKYVFMQLELLGLIEKWNFTESDLEIDIESHYNLINKIIVEKIGEVNLIVLWKLHFIKFGKPKHMPDWWKPNLIKVIKKGLNKDSKSDLVEIDLKEEKLYTLIKKYELDEIANLYI